METFITNSGKLLVDSFGRLLIPAIIPAIEFEWNGSVFPATSFMIAASVSATIKIYIDFGDGTPIYEEVITTGAYNPLGGNGRVTSSALGIRNYGSSALRKIKIYFDKPELINQILLGSLNLVREFPLNIGLYKLDNLTINSARFDTFPIQLSGGTYRILVLLQITTTPINYIPKWIYNSKITTLRLALGFKLSDLTASNFEKIINITGLTTFSFSDNNVNSANLPNVFKDIPTLRTIASGVNPITEIPLQFNNAKQITTLEMGHSGLVNIGAKNPLLTSWGVGIANMPNLTKFTAGGCANIPTDIITGLETSGVKNIDTAGCYLTISRVDDSIVSAYNLVSSLASKTVGNTLLRNVTWTNGSTGINFFNANPTGIYKAPTGFVLGSSNGTPTNAREMIYVLTKQYRWTITINEAGAGLSRTQTVYNYLS